MAKRRESNKEPVTSHGGWRPGAGREKKLKDAGPRKVYLDAETVKILTDLGDGYLSPGIRRAAQIVLQFQSGKEVPRNGKPNPKARARTVPKKLERRPNPG